jgi:hypothetical protein
MAKKRQQPSGADFDIRNPKHLIAALREHLEGDDRAIAIIGGSLVEDALEELLRLHFVANTDDSESATRSDQLQSEKEDPVDNLFKPERPLGSFSAKIDTCFALGLIGKITHHNLARIKDIRNRFAHKILMLDAKQKMGRLTFKSQQISAWCKDLREIEGYIFNKADPERVKFTKICMIVVTTLMTPTTKPDSWKMILP